MRHNLIRPKPLGCSSSTAMTASTGCVRLLGLLHWLLALVLGDRRLAVADGQVGLVDLHHALQAFAVRAHTIVRPKRCSIVQAVSSLPSPRALTPCFWFVRYHAPASHARNGVRVLPKVVPAVTVPWCEQLRHVSRARPGR